jgi:transcriptional regulator with XRE-family HTH domain
MCIITDMRTLGDNVRRLREGLKLTQIQLAAVCNIAQAQISKYEINRRLPSADSLIALAKGLDCSVDDLVEGMDPEYDQRRQHQVQNLLDHGAASLSNATSIGDAHAQLASSPASAVLQNVLVATTIFDITDQLQLLARAIAGGQNPNLGYDVPELPASDRSDSRREVRRTRSRKRSA